MMRNPTGITSTPSVASLTSRAPIDLPRNSGVRPTMRPAMKTVSVAKSRIE